jgi:hypothetical protein
MRNPRLEKRLAARDRFLTEDYLRILQRLARLRVATASQLGRLCDPLVDTSPQNVHTRLSRLESHGLLRSGLVRPARGAYSAKAYWLAWPALVALGRADETQLLRRPAQQILEYLVFRNEVYATLRAHGWRVASPVLVPEADHAAYLARYTAWAKAARHRHLATLEHGRAGPAALMQARLDYERVEKFAPTALTFDFAMQLDSNAQPTTMLWLAIDDPRRSIKTQVADLPVELHPELRILLRDHRTHYDLQTQQPYKASKRLRDWHLALTKRFTSPPFTGEQLLATTAQDPPFRDLWAIRTAVPRLT